MEEKEYLAKTMKHFLRKYFYADFDILLTLIKGDEKLICKLINNYGKHNKHCRQLVAWEGSDKILEEVRPFLNKFYTQKQTLDLLDKLCKEYKIL